jgi:DNA-binding NtrC family response regulator
VDADPDVIDALREMPFPGNVRELENLVRAALVRKHDEGPLRLCDLPEWAWRRLAEPQATETPLRASIAPDGGGGGDLNLSRALAGVEKRVLQAALLTTHGNQTETARLLGITPRSVYNKLRKYNLETKASGS